MKKLTLCMLLTSLTASSVFALDLPDKLGYDARMRYTLYNPKDVVQIDTVIGIATHIVLEEGEQYRTHAFGDAAAYSFAMEQNHIFIKPRAENADTNLIVITDRRSYSFRLTFHERSKTPPVYQLTFRYPDTVAHKNREAVERAAVEDGFKDQRDSYNLSYSMSGDTDIAPINAWDNNEFTFFKFPGNRDIPGIYMVDTDGKESIVNRTTTGDASNVIKVHKVNAKWMLRLGRRVLAVFNEAYDPNGITNTSGTASPTVQRVIKGAINVRPQKG